MRMARMGKGQQQAAAMVVWGRWRREPGFGIRVQALNHRTYVCVCQDKAEGEYVRATGSLSAFEADNSLE